MKNSVATTKDVILPECRLADCRDLRQTDVRVLGRLVYRVKLFHYVTHGGVARPLFPPTLIAVETWFTEAKLVFQKFTCLQCIIRSFVKSIPFVLNGAAFMT